jgi:inosine-uridine nucleoside N-ribohydrolase
MKVLLDVDTGVDDALGLLYLADAQRRGEVEIIASGTVGGNADVEKTTRNTLKLWEMVDLDIPVAKGANKPVLTELNAVPHIHGDDGLANTHLDPPHRQPTGEHAVDQIIRLSREYEGELILLAFGPLTNLGIAFLKEANLANRLKRIILMGGSLSGGNETPAAEANIYNDVEAAYIVFNSGVPITMVGLDVTHHTYLEEKDLAPLERIGNEQARFTLHLIRYMMQSYQNLGRKPQCVLHDPLSAGVCLYPDLVRTEKCHVDIETRGVLTRGMTVADRRPWPAHEANVDVALEVDATRFVTGYMAALLRWSQL